MKEKTISIENSHQNVHNEWPIESTRSIVMHNLGLELDFEGFVTQESIPSTNELLDFIITGTGCQLCPFILDGVL